MFSCRSFGEIRINGFFSLSGWFTNLYPNRPFAQSQPSFTESCREEILTISFLRVWRVRLHPHPQYGQTVSTSLKFCLPLCAHIFPDNAPVGQTATHWPQNSQSRSFSNGGQIFVFMPISSLYSPTGVVLLLQNTLTLSFNTEACFKVGSQPHQASPHQCQRSVHPVFLWFFIPG